MEASQKHPIMVFGPHRSGTNFVQKILELNYPVEQIGTGRADGDRTWKHHSYSNRLADILDKEYSFAIVCARDPIKWLNGIVKFNANLWKTCPVISKDNSIYNWEYKNLVEYIKDHPEWEDFKMDIRLCIKHWNDWYFSWFYQTRFTNYTFIHYHDMLIPEKRDKVLGMLEIKYGLERTSDTLSIPGEVEHSRAWNDMKTKEELDISLTSNLKHEWLEYAFENFDPEIVEKIEASRMI
tara:strand:- start:860 stop:1573 length:714 start_codon:yes stop_codon:yes gene_type:complete